MRAASSAAVCGPVAVMVAPAIVRSVMRFSLLENVVSSPAGIRAAGEDVVLLGGLGAEAAEEVDDHDAVALGGTLGRVVTGLTPLARFGPLL
jgi:hypothetical protein